MPGPSAAISERLAGLRRKQLAADLEHAYEIGNLFSEFQRC